LRRREATRCGEWPSWPLAPGDSCYWSQANSGCAIDPLLAGSIVLLLGLAGISFLWADDQGNVPAEADNASLLGHSRGRPWPRALSLRDISRLMIWVLGTLTVCRRAGRAASGGRFGPWAGDYRFAGTVHPNTQGPALAALCLAALALAP